MRPVEGVVVGGVDHGEANRIVRFLCAEEGRISALARHARASRRRFAGVLEPGTRLRLHRQRGRGQLPNLIEVDRLGGPNRARGDIDRIALLAYGCELCAALAPESHPAPKLFRLLTVWLDLLEDEATAGIASRAALEAKAMTFAGVAPALVRCPVCGEALDDPLVFDFDGGGGRHGRCGGGRPVSARALLELETLRRTPLSETLGRVLAGPTWLLSDYVQHHLGRALKSRRLIEDLAGSG